MRLLYQGGSAVNLKQLEYFVTLAETEHYRKAAESLYITEPSLNRAVRDLEKEMGVPLFEKRGAFVLQISIFDSFKTARR